MQQNRPANRNTNPEPQRGLDFRQGVFSRNFRQRQTHGFTQPDEWHNAHRPQGNRHEMDHENMIPKDHSGKGPKGYQRTDARIQEELCERLMQDPHIDASQIEVEVKEGVVYLNGSVDHRVMKWRAEDMAETVHGVRDVICHISVRSLWKKWITDRPSQE